MKRKLRVAVATVTYEERWQKDAEDAAGRLRLLERILGKIASSELVVLPAGFIRVSTESAAKVRAEQVGALCRARTAIAFGVDLIAATKGWREFDPLLQSFGYLALKDGSHPLWHVRQLAATSQQRVAVARIENEERTASIGESGIGLLVCGEMMGRVYGKGSRGRRLRAMVDGAGLVVDVAHSDIKVGSSPRTWSAALRETAKHTASDRCSSLTTFVRTGCRGD